MELNTLELLLELNVAGWHGEWQNYQDPYIWGKIYFNVLQVEIEPKGNLNLKINITIS